MKVISFNPKIHTIKPSYREKPFKSEYALIDLFTKRTPVTIRFYKTKGRLYCCVWIMQNPIHAMGSAWDDNFNEHTVARMALENAGFEFSGGGLVHKTEQLLDAIGKHFGGDYLIHNAHS